MASLVPRKKTQNRGGGLEGEQEKTGGIGKEDLTSHLSPKFKKTHLLNFPGGPVAKTTHASTAEGTGLIPCWGNKIQHATTFSQINKSH